MTLTLGCAFQFLPSKSKSCFHHNLGPVADVRGHAQVPAIYWLSGLTCTDENFSQKAGAFAHAAREKV
jgi:hypothetical protein